MFCSNCGKTIRPEDQYCPSCNAPIGDNRFGGIPYTSAQFTIKPGQTEFEPLNDYTRTTYTSMADADQSNSEADSRTTYRPVYEGASAPEDVRRDMRAAVADANAEPAEEIEEAEEETAAPAPEFYSPMAQETLDQLDEDLRPDEAIDRSQFKVRKIQSTGRAGISKDVSDYIAKLESDQSRRGRHRKAADPVYEEYPEDQPVYDDYQNQAAEGEYYEDQDGAFDEIDDEDFEDMGARSRISLGRILKIVIALIIVAALFVGGMIWIRHISDSTASAAPIEGVSETLYEEGIALIKSRTESSYINERINAYRNEGPAAMALKLNADTTSIDALLSAEPAANDATFIKALQAIQTNISNAIAMDALAANGADASAIAKSEANWELVADSIKQLEGVTTAAELTAIINGTKITVTESTPAPTATPVVYKSLVKGDKNNDVMKMQVRLYEMGYLKDDRDGNFGSKTQTAVKTFQERAGLDVTGIADNATLTLMYSDDAPYAPGVTTPTPKPTATPEPEKVIQPAEVQQ